MRQIERERERENDEFECEKYIYMEKDATQFKSIKCIKIFCLFTCAQFIRKWMHENAFATFAMNTKVGKAENHELAH